MLPTSSPGNNLFNSDEIPQKSPQTNVKNMYRYGSVECFIENYVPKNPDILFVIWVEEVSNDLARVIYANDNNTLVIMRSYENNPFEKMPLVVRAKPIEVGLGEDISKLRCVTVTKLSEHLARGITCIDYIRDINTFEHYYLLESQIEKVAKQEGKSVRHIVGRDWMCYVDGMLTNAILAAWR